MNKIEINKEKCIKCQKCADVCSLNIISKSNGIIPVIQNTENCFLCGHCISVCEQNALTHNQFDLQEIKPLEYRTTSDDMMSLLKMKRSCRHYEKNAVDKEIIEELIEVAKLAPTVFNSEERGFIVISNRKTLNDLRLALKKSTQKGLRLLNVFSHKPLNFMLSKEAKAYFRRGKLDFEMTLLKESQGSDAYFHEAPHLILFTGIAKDPFGKDHALNAMHYFMMLAHAKGLGSCINGHVQDASKVVSKFVEVPNQHKIYCAITLGYPKLKYINSVSRKSPVIVWKE